MPPRGRPKSTTDYFLRTLPDDLDPEDREPDDDPLEPEETEPRDPLDPDELEPRETVLPLDELFEEDPLFRRDL